MKLINNMKIGVKLIVAFIIVAIIAGVVGAIAIFNIDNISKNDSVLYNNVTLPLSYTSEMAKQFQEVRVKTRDMILETDQADINNSYSEIQACVEKINEYGDKFKATMISEDIKKAYNEFLDTRAAYRANLENLLQLCLENKDVEAFALINGDMKKTADDEQAAIDNLVALKVSAGEDKYDANKKTSNTAIITMVIVVAVGVLLAILLGIFISRMIGNPIKKVAKAAKLIADGDLNVELDINSKDETGALAASFAKMADNLNEVMTNISVSSIQVSTGSKQVSDSSMALSQGATEQASSVEELSASLEEISSQTKLNAENADQANKLAEIAMKNANGGNAEMKEMLKAMEDINESSSNISKIIKVIDDIAFQTNILALNAAVEAARAGQHGKGFAVVAEEVRNLAARSAKAAKETTGMIEGSVKKVEGGTKIANQTADALAQIVENITKVAGLVGDIATASNEQAAGIAQINQGILQVSDVIQMNSSTSQESAAASEELSSMAEMLKSQVARFKLKTGNNGKQNMDKSQLSPDIVKMLDQMSGKNAIASSEASVKPESRRIILDSMEYGKY